MSLFLRRGLPVFPTLHPAEAALAAGVHNPIKVRSCIFLCIYLQPWLNMELDLQSLFGPHVHSSTYSSWLRRATPPHLPYLGSYTRALLAAKIGDIFL
jgi:hypothetical protein